MSMVCPKCNGAFDEAAQCPECGVRLLYQGKNRPSPGHSDPSSQWQQTPWGRILVGMALAQGLAYSLELLFTAGILAATEQGSNGIWTTLWGLVLLQVFY